MARTRAPAPLFARKYASAPEALPEAGKALWNAIVKGFGYDHFTAADLPLLEEFIRCRLIVSTCNDFIGEDGLFQETPSGMKPHPALTIRDNQLKNLASLATKLRLPVSSRIRPESAQTRPRGTGAAPWNTVDDDLIPGLRS